MDRIRSACLLVSLLLLSLEGLPAQAPGGKAGKAAPRAEKKAAAKKEAEPAGKERGPERPLNIWWSRSFAGRRAVTFEKEPARGEPVLLRFGTAGLTRPDGRDLRLLADYKVQVPLEILEIGPGDRSAIAFEAIEPGHDLHIYFGCPTSADAPRRPGREIRGGLRMEVLTLPEGSAGTWPEMTKLMKAAKEPVGILYPDAVELGVPPLGRIKDYILRYVGVLKVEAAGEHTFETASDGPSFFLLDGKPLASWPGFHDLSGYADGKQRKEHSGTAVLKAGLHEIEYVVATKRGGPHVLGLQGPGDPFARPIRPERFRPWIHARPGPLEAPGEAAADFDWRILSDSTSDAERHEMALVELAWSGDLAGRELGDVDWDFGDGQKGRGSPIRHVYLGHGIFQVSARASVGAGKVLEAERRVAVRFESLRMGDLNRILEEYFKAVQGYDLQRLPEPQLLQFIWLSKKDFAWEESLHKALEVWFARRLPLTPEGIARDGLRRARRLIQDREGWDRAEGILQRMSMEAPSPEDRLDGGAWLARSRMLRDDGKGDAKEAEAMLRQVRAEGGAGDPARRAGIFLGDLLLSRGETEEAEKVLSDMEEGPFRRFEGERQVASGAHALGFDNLLRRGAIRDAREELDLWEWELPRDRLAGQIQLRRSALLRTEKKHAAALREVEQVLALKTAANQIPRALLVQAEILADQGDKAGARACLERVVKEHPERPEKKEAEERLKALAP